MEVIPATEYARLLKSFATAENSEHEARVKFLEIGLLPTLINEAIAIGKGQSDLLRDSDFPHGEDVVKKFQ